MYQCISSSDGWNKTRNSDCTVWMNCLYEDISFIPCCLLCPLWLGYCVNQTAINCSCRHKRPIKGKQYTVSVIFYIRVYVRFVTDIKTSYYSIFECEQCVHKNVEDAVITQVIPWCNEDNSSAHLRSHCRFIFVRQTTTNLSSSLKFWQIQTQISMKT